MAGFFKTTIIGGLVFLLPFAALIIIFSKASSALKPLVDPLAALLPFESLIGLKIPIVLTVILIIMMCFVAGLFAKASVAQNLVKLIEANLLSKIPGYSLLKDIGEEVSVQQDQSVHKVVLLRLDDAWQLGLQIEQLVGDKHVAVFIPDSPTPQTGSVLIVSADRVKPTNISIMQLFSCLRNRGSGIGRALSEK